MTIAALALASALAGVWHGSSICVANRPACHDEAAVYRIADIPNQPGHVSIDGGKVVNGQVSSMGVITGIFDDAGQTLVSTYRYGSLRLKLHGDRLDGTLSTPAGLVIRRINLTRVK